MPFQTLTRDSFAKLFIDTGRRYGFFRASHYVRNLFTLESNFSRDRLCLDNAYEEYLSAPFWMRHSVFGSLVHEFGRFALHHAAGEKLTRSHLMPHVKERIALAQIESDSVGSDPATAKHPYRVMGEHLALEVVFDHGRAMLPASLEDLADIGLSFEDALDVANQNLLKRGVDRFNSPRPGFYISAWSDRFDASRMHLPTVVPTLRVIGRPVVMTPNRDTLLVTGSNDTVGLRMMAEMAAGGLLHPRPMTGYAFRLDARWTPWLPDDDMPSYSLFKKLAIESDSAYYGAQLEQQDDIRATEGRDVCLPGLRVNCDYLNEEWTSQTTWALGRPCLLPKADRIVVVQTNSERNQVPVGVIPWDVLDSNSLLRPTGLYPERYRVDADISILRLIEIGMNSPESAAAAL